MLRKLKGRRLKQPPLSGEILLKKIGAKRRGHGTKNVRDDGDKK